MHHRPHLLLPSIVTSLACLAALPCAASARMTAPERSVVSESRSCRLAVHRKALTPKADPVAERAAASTRLAAAPSPRPGARRRLLRREVTSELGRRARAILDASRDEPYGAEQRFEIGGRRYLAVVERHYHEPGGEARPWGWHRGISLFTEQAL